jgi:hypothetical protein
MGKINLKYMEYEWQGVMLVRNNKIWKNSVSMSACTENTGDTKPVINDFPIIVVNNIPIIGSIDAALALGITGGTPLLMQVKISHER